MFGSDEFRGSIIGAADWSSWAERWETQQQFNNPWREERFRVMLELVAQFVGPEPRWLCDLACGPGAISARVLRRFQLASILAVDVDPFLLAIGEGSLGVGG